ncbi:CMGC/SRPK protein kinase [Arthroderma uncinatum]|uniref:CMGC/SRPK protein kinase n=1 Tax=Arthroderma uncinatum TaxID=74035 RepID=UPI00144AF0F5|nr:CMGC/SRPK protein kinase [Arthroderma uncinatum]KAF3484187.1 CMGC/SRPK protein kinase [Arthroderma uncinatum]
MLPLRLLTPRRTLFSFAKKSLWQLPSNSGPPIPQQELVDEEACSDYGSASFYPAKPGEVLAKKFQLLVKIGWGSQSTVWLARDVSSNNADDACHEKEIENHITGQQSEHRGRVILRTCLDDFEVTGPKGKHMCLVYEPMREPLWILQRRFVNRKLPLPIAKAYIYFLLVGLDHLHSECKVVHTDLKLGNILMSFENESTLTNFIKRQQPMQCKVDNESGRTIYRCHIDFGALAGREIKNMIPQIADFGLATRLDRPSTLNGMVGEQLGTYPIQPDYYRAPEVILGCGWDFKADIWNFGVLLWNILGNKELFQQVRDTNGQYDAKSHLAEMIALLGPPPGELLAKSKAMSEHNWPQPVMNETGALCNNALEFFGGPFFNAEGKFCYNELIPSRSLEDTIPFLEEKDREAFLTFIRDMLIWLPEKRKTARELIDHPFLKLRG